ncbi:MAG TPA: tetratricopeptide repeat protein, partial [Candidatus Sulfopaludibacter sp.]|nr:tetratricopeptide repeat protein [Candidatus Sulfopaludibacter sp.]
MQTTRGARRVSIAAVGVFCLVFSGPPLAAQAQLALSLNDRGLAAAERSDFAQAERLYGEAIQIWRGLGTAYEAQTAATLVNLGQTLCNEGKAGDGVSVLEQALALDRHSLGSKHLSTLTSLTALGHAYVLSGDSAHAETALSEALAAERELYPGDVLLEHTLLGLSLLRRQERRLDEALQYGEEALNAALKTGGELSPEAGMNYENVARLHRLAGRPDRALPLFRKAVFIYERTLGLKDPSLAMLHSEVGLALLEDGEAALA